MHRAALARRLRVPDDAAGSRLDAFLAQLVGSRASAGASDRGRRARRRRRASEELEAGGRAGGRVRAACRGDADRARGDGAPPRVRGRAPARRRQAGRARRPPGAGHATGTLVHGLVGVAGGGEEDRRGIVHRLDRDTSGLMVVARTEEAFERLQQQVRDRALEREYVALVRGRPRSRSGRIDAPIGRDRNDAMRHSLDTDTPREAVTHFEVVELLPGHALLRVKLETGRTHQIRVHLAAIDLPVAGDPLYGVRDDLGLERQFLHASRLAFAHPITGEPVETLSPLPADLETRPGSRGETGLAGYTFAGSSLLPGGSPRAGVPAVLAGSVRARRLMTARQTRKEPHGCCLHARASGGRSPFRPPDPPLEPEDEAIHLRRARRHLHHRPAADAGAARRGVRVRAQPRRARRHDPVRRHQEAGAGRRRRAGEARRHAVRVEPLARRPAHELEDDRGPHRSVCTSCATSRRKVSSTCFPRRSASRCWPSSRSSSRTSAASPT